MVMVLFENKVKTVNILRAKFNCECVSKSHAIDL